MVSENRPRSRRPTIRDVAERAGVSKSLVSLVIHDSPRVSDKSRTAVREAIDELGYRPSAMARGLVNRHSNLLGIVMSNPHDQFFASVIDGLALHIDENQLGLVPLILHGNNDLSLESHAIEQFLELRVEEVILLRSELDDDAIERLAREVPVTVIGRWLDSSNVDVIVSDDRRGAEMATAHLLDLGHRHIAHINGGRSTAARNREDGYRDLMGEAGYEPRVVEGGFTLHHGEEGARQLIGGPGPPPTAVFAANDLSAIGAMEVLRRAGHDIPGDISVIGYDDILAARLRGIDLTTINQPAEQMGRMAARYACERIDGAGREARKVLMEPKLVMRESTRALT